MKLDLSCKIERKQLEALRITGQSAKPDLSVRPDIDKTGHLGTHFDVMNKEFPLEHIITRGKIFDISHIAGREAAAGDLDLNTVHQNDFVIFHSGILKKYGYGTKKYFSAYIELSNDLISRLISRKISFIGVDMAGAKGPSGHLRIDLHCAEKGVFIIENLNNLDLLLEKTKGAPFTVYTFPVNFHGFTGLPCRVVAEV